MTFSKEAQAFLGERRRQMFPTLPPEAVERLRRFGEKRSYRQGSLLVRAGEVGPGLAIVLSGEIKITQNDGERGSQHIVTHGPGSFMGELAQLSGRPSLVDALALSNVEALVLGPDHLRAMLIAEASLGEQIMRALILRRVGLIQSGAGGLVIVGDSKGPDCLPDWLPQAQWPSLSVV